MTAADAPMEITRKISARLVIAAGLFLLMAQIALAQHPRLVSLDSSLGANGTSEATLPLLPAAAFSDMKGLNNSLVLSNGIQMPAEDMTSVAPDVVGARNMEMVPANENLRLRIPSSMNLPVVFNDQAFNVQINRAPISGKIQAPMSNKTPASSTFRNATLDRYIGELSGVLTQPDTALTKAQIDAIYGEVSGSGGIAFIKPSAKNPQSQPNPSSGLRLASTGRVNRLRATVAAIAGVSLGIAPKLLASPVEQHDVFYSQVKQYGAILTTAFTFVSNGISLAIKNHPELAFPGLIGIMTIVFFSALRSRGRYMNDKTTSVLGTVARFVSPLLVVAGLCFFSPTAVLYLLAVGTIALLFRNLVHNRSVVRAGMWSVRGLSDGEDFLLTVEFVTQFFAIVPALILLGMDLAQHVELASHLDSVAVYGLGGVALVSTFFALLFMGFKKDRDMRIWSNRILGPVPRKRSYAGVGDTPPPIRWIFGQRDEATTPPGFLESLWNRRMAPPLSAVCRMGIAFLSGSRRD
jgi:hypothetical protein